MRHLLVLAVAVPLIASCGGPDQPAGGGSGSTGPPGSTGSPPVAGGSGSTGSTGTPGPAPTGTGGRCADGTTITARVGAAPAAVCLTRGGSLLVRTEPSHLQPWAPLASSDESIVRCRSRRLADGAVEATCTAVGPGTATLSTSTAPFGGDPHGPPQDTWRLPITVPS
jgi:hypothetical protein